MLKKGNNGSVNISPDVMIFFVTLPSPTLYLLQAPILQSSTLSWILCPHRTPTSTPNLLNFYPKVMSFL